jgi:hypothetical protein
MRNRSRPRRPALRRRRIIAVVTCALWILGAEVDAMDLFANSGLGFHSNDARAAVDTSGAGALARAYGAETGFRLRPLERARISADVWYLRLASEQVWSGDAGGTEAAGRRGATASTSRGRSIRRRGSRSTRT